MRICKVEKCGKKHKAKRYCGKHYLQIWRHSKILERTRFDPNEIIDCGDYYEICLYNLKCKEIARTKIDKDDLEKVKQYKWSLSNGYTLAYPNSKHLYLHHLILGRKNGFVNDHINLDPLDNRKSNLRFATHQHNLMNQKVKGITWYKKNKKWIAYIKINYKKIHLGSFKKEEDAIKSRREGEQKYFGEFSCKEH